LADLDYYGDRDEERDETVTPAPETALELLNAEDGSLDAGFEHLRAAMSKVIDALAEGRLPLPAELVDLNELIGRVPVRAQLEVHGDGFLIDMTPVASGREAELRELAGDFASMLRRDPRRIKLCEECGRVFWDASKSRTRLWCDNRTCGNRVRVRRFRQAHRSDERP
jgi:predicted RNA-binding Zn ribbon-like protein